MTREMALQQPPDLTTCLAASVAGTQAVVEASDDGADDEKAAEADTPAEAAAANGGGPGPEQEEEEMGGEGCRRCTYMAY